MTDSTFPHLVQFKERYEREYLPRYEKFASQLYSLIAELIAKADVPVDRIDYRVKSVDSFLEKIDRSRSYSNPFEQIKDFVGLRIMTYYRADVNTIVELLQKEFKVHPEMSGDKLDEQDPREFRYSAYHLKISLFSQREILPEWKDYRDFTAEIQVRSMLEHAWAAVEHHLSYKGPSKPSSEILRRFSRAKAKLEEVDEEFIALRQLAEQKAEEEKLSEQANKYLLLDIKTLKGAVHQLELQYWTEFGVDAGMKRFARLVGRNHESSMEVLLSALDTIAVSMIHEFSSLLENTGEVKNALKRFVDIVKALGEEVYAVPIDVIIFAVTFSKPAAFLDGFDWGNNYHPFVIESLRRTCRELSEHGA